MVRGFTKGGKFRPFKKKGGKTVAESLDEQKRKFPDLILARSNGIGFALKKGRFRGSKQIAVDSVESAFETRLQAGIPEGLAKIERKEDLNEVKREFGASGIDG